MIEQLEIWAEYLSSYRSDQRSRGYPSIVKGGYYWLAIDAGVFKKITNDEEKTPCDITYFHFDPEKEPPVINAENVCWALEGKKVLILLPHAESTPKIADYYGYRDVYNGYIVKRQQESDEKDKERLVKYLRKEEEAKNELQRLDNKKKELLKILLE